MQFVDEDKIAVTGVSYGGYIAAMMLSERQEDLLACGVAVSPVVDWRYYGMFHLNQIFLGTPEMHNTGTESNRIQMLNYSAFRQIFFLPFVHILKAF